MNKLNSLQIKTAHESNLIFDFKHEGVQYRTYIENSVNEGWRVNCIIYWSDNGREYLDNPQDELRIALVELFNKEPKVLRYTEGKAIKN
ncbi:hypothetical protein [Brevibacillus sp. NRS-1366]|uniref:hypothetical protein n=1 Tax=Brevibacillus sp. NRS-1366 TaxID=3233899 RepID=UPI003D1E4808